MSGLNFVLALIALLGDPITAEAQGTLILRLVGRTESVSCSGARVELRHGADASAADKPVRVASFDDEAEQTLSLGVGSWFLTLTAENCWAASQSVAITGEGASHVKLTAWETTSIRAGLRVPEGSRMPSQVKVMFSPSFKDGGLVGGASFEPVGSRWCPVGDGGRVLCEIPAATRLDLRLSAKGFGPEYWWGQELQTRSLLDLGVRTFRAGASLAGWVSFVDRRDFDSKQVSARLEPYGLTGVGGESSISSAIMGHTGEVQSNGFFRFNSLKAGEYLLKVSAPGYAESSIGVLLVEGRESSLRDPIVLDHPQPASFLLEPPTDAKGQSWSLSLLKIDRYRSQALEVSQEEVPLNGLLELEGLSVGTYIATVYDAEGNRVATREAQVGVEPMPILVSVTVLSVEGDVTIGDKKLRATLWFGTRTGSERVEVMTDEDGHYATVLPRAGLWSVEVSAEEPKVSRKVSGVEVPEAKNHEPVEVDIRLPATRLSGVVQEKDGSRPKSTVVLYVQPSEASEFLSVKVPKSGDFKFEGLAEGPVRLHAESARAITETVTLDLVDGVENSLALTLRPFMNVTGTVVSEDGRPVPGATVLFLPPESSFSTRKTMAGADGSFEAQVMTEGRSVFVVLSSPGRTLTIYPVTLTDEPLQLMLPSAGGTLTLRLPADDPSGPRLRLFFRDGALFPLAEVERWAALNPPEVASRGEFVVQQLAPGEYRVCSFPASEYGSWLAGLGDVSKCHSGTVVPFRNLELSF